MLRPCVAIERHAAKLKRRSRHIVKHTALCGGARSGLLQVGAERAIARPRAVSREVVRGYDRLRLLAPLAAGLKEPRLETVVARSPLWFKAMVAQKGRALARRRRQVLCVADALSRTRFERATLCEPS